MILYQTPATSSCGSSGLITYKYKNVFRYVTTNYATRDIHINNIREHNGRENRASITGKR